MPQGRVGQHCDDVEGEDRTDGVCHIGFGSADHRRCGGDGRGAADAGPDADQGAQIAVDSKQMANSPGGEKRERERPQHHRQRRQPGVRDLSKRQPGPQDDNRQLQYGATRENDTGTQPNVQRPFAQHDAQSDAEHDPTDRRADHRHKPAQDRRHRGDTSAHQQARHDGHAGLGVPRQWRRRGLRGVGTENRGHGTTRVCSPQRLYRRRPRSLHCEAQRRPPARVFFPSAEYPGCSCP